MEIVSSYFGELTVKEAAQSVKLMRVIASIKLVKKGVLLVVGQYGRISAGKNVRAVSCAIAWDAAFI